MAKIAMMGAGSFVFTRDILTDILSYPSLPAVPSHSWTSQKSG